MIRTSKFAIAFAGAAALAGAAVAQTTVKASFTYDESATVEANYAAFESTARRACRTDIREAGSVANKQQIESDCGARLMANAVATTHNAELTALYAERTHPPSAGEVLAALK